MSINGIYAESITATIYTPWKYRRVHQIFPETLYNDVMTKYTKIILSTWGDILQYTKKPLLASCGNIYPGNNLLNDFYQACVPVVFLSKPVTENGAQIQI